MKKLLKDLPEIIIAVLLAVICRKDLTSVINIIGFYLGMFAAIIIILSWVKNYLEAIIKK